ncbi:hypothetical protein [Actinokineospora sp. HUAS TT18]|uniref:hypothetical protein n=1 Tax=Actinokineospora sp. HUAS TT18 TaxID=3447451 RepID=UPI003F526ED2
MAITPTRQRNAVSQGIALGLLMCGRNSIAVDKVKVDLAFEGAWPRWTYRARFPQVNTDLANGSDGIRVMTRADAGKRVHGLYWSNTGATMTIHTRVTDWTADNPDDVEYALEAIDGDVPLAGWEELAQEFLRRYER